MDFKRLEKDVFTMFMFQGNNVNNENYDPKLYIPHPNFKPQEGPTSFKTALREFRFEVEEATKPLLKKRNCSNLPLRYIHHLRNIKRSSDVIVTATDKNLGAAIIDTKTYIQRNLKDHLLDATRYRRFDSKEAAQASINEVHDRIVEMVKQKKFPTGVPETYLSRFYFCSSEKGKVLPRAAKYYALPKIHKQPWSLRPVVSQCGCFLEGLSKWLDYELQKVKHLCPAYLRDTWDLKHRLEALDKKGLIDHNTRLFTADAKAMYPSIDTDHGLKVMEDWLHFHVKELPKNFPSSLILKGLEMVMRNNIFTFGDTFWLQLKGTAIGTSVACMYATIYFSYHEEKKIILPTAKKRGDLLLYVRFIDNVFAIIKRPESTEILNKQLNSFGKEDRRLVWEASAPARVITFLDLTISLSPLNSIITQTFQKKMNNYLYLPQESAHQMSVHQGIIKSQIWRYYHQNTRLEDFQNVVGDFFKRLMERGHRKASLEKKFLKAAKEIEEAAYDNSLTAPSSKGTSSSSLSGQPASRPIFLHVQHHPKGLKNSTIKRLFERHCLPTFKSMPNEYGARIGAGGVVLATHRCKNISELVKQSTLCQNRPDDILVSRQIDVLTAAT